MRRLPSSIAALGLALLLAPAAGAVDCPSTFEEQVLALVNLERTAAGLAPLQHHARLLEAARRHSADMADGNFREHTGSDGSDAGERLEDAGYDWWTWGENIAYGYPTSASVMNAWMNSSGHRANILNPNFVHIGVGIVDEGAPFWTQAFAAGDALETACPEPPGGGGDSIPPIAPRADCSGGQLAASARLCRDQPCCWGRLAAKPAADPDPLVLAACLDRAEASFADRWDRVRQQAAAKGALCHLDETGASREAAVEPQLEALAESILVGANPASKHDAKLRAGLVNGVGSLCSDAAAVTAKNAKKPNAAKLAATRAKARAKFDARSAKALAKAADKGVTYGGPASASLGDQTEALVEGWIDDATP